MSTRDSSPWASPSAQAIPINAFRSRTSSTSSSDTGYFSSSLSSTSTLSTQHYACAYPSWPSGGFAPQTRRPPTSYVSDDDLFGLDASPRLREAPAPPRTAQAWLNGAAQQHHGNPAVTVAAQRAQIAAAAAVAQPAADWRRKSIVPKKTVTRTKSSSSASSAGSKA